MPKEQIKASDLPQVDPPTRGESRQWMKCPKCGKLQYYDYVPYGFSNPIMTTNCGHDQFGRKLHEYMIYLDVVESPEEPQQITPTKEPKPMKLKKYLKKFGRLISTKVEIVCDSEVRFDDRLLNAIIPQELMDRHIIQLGAEEDALVITVEKA